ncbi:MAG: flippase-like domain-containing protein [Alphaproteobacteria bacterium]|nr:flippase-like domain-containing protein [Alphaproteobacteria bacterium]
MPASKPSRRRAIGRVVTGLALAAGLALGGLLLSEYGVARIFGLIARAGWGLLVVASVHAGQLVLTGVAWRCVSAGETRPSLPTFIALRWLREGINSLLPVLPVAGLLAAIRLLMRRGLSLPTAVASVLTDSSVELITQIGFTLLGVLLLVLARGAEALAGWMAAGLGGLMIAAALLLPAQWLGIGRLAEHTARRLGWAGRVEGLHEAIMAGYRTPRRLAAAAAAHLGAWLLGGPEVWLALYFLGADASLLDAMVIEALGLAVRGAAFMIPGALGVQEGGFVLVCGLFGISPELALALSLVKRLRDVAFGVPSLGLWLVLERHGGAVPPRLFGAREAV